MAKLNDTDAHVLAILYDHGAMTFADADKAASAKKMIGTGHVTDFGQDHVVLSPKGLKWLNNH